MSASPPALAVSAELAALMREIVAADSAPPEKMQRMEELMRRDFGPPEGLLERLEARQRALLEEAAPGAPPSAELIGLVREIGALPPAPPEEMQRLEELIRRELGSPGDLEDLFRRSFGPPEDMVARVYAAERAAREEERRRELEAQVREAKEREEATAQLMGYERLSRYLSEAFAAEEAGADALEDLAATGGGRAALRVLSKTARELLDLRAAPPEQALVGAPVALSEGAAPVGTVARCERRADNLVNYWSR